MSFDEKLKDLSARIESQRQMLLTEEAMKTAIILKMLSALEYDVFDPSEVIPEFTADVGIKKGEKVDYAIRVGGQISILIECKAPNAQLDLKHASQLYRYFSVTDAKFAVLTNGYDWEFYTDLDEPNRMDKRPFLSFNLTDIDTTSASELSRFRKSVYDVAAILSTARRLKYISALKTRLKEEFDNPSDEFVAFFGRQIYDGMFTANVRQEFTPLVKRSVSEVIRDRVNARLKSALLQNTTESPEEDIDLEEKSEIETTEDEWDGFRIAVAIAARVIDPSRVVIRDQRSYCGVLIDNNNRRPLLRMYFNSPTTRYLGLFDGEIEEKVAVRAPVDLYRYADRICATAEKYKTVP